MALSARRNKIGFQTLNPNRARHLLTLLLAAVIAAPLAAEVPLEGFIPLVGMSLTDQFNSSEGGDALFFVSEGRSGVGGQQLGNGSPYYDVALFDTGAATHILTHQASGANGFDIAGNGFEGGNVQVIGGATGFQELDINDPHGIYAAGMRYGDTTGGDISFNPTQLYGQISFATLSAQDERWELPNIIGMPLAHAHAVHIQNSDPVIISHGDDTIRTPQIDFHPIGTGGQGIVRRSTLKLRPGADFATGPLYIFDTSGVLEGNPLHDNPASPSLIPSGGMFIEVNMTNGSESFDDTEFLFDTGASLTVISTDTALDIGIDPILDDPEFTLAVEGSGGVTAGIPGFVVDTLSLNTAGGSFELSNVPIAVLDVANPNDPGNIIDGILGMNIFSNRDLVIDANPSLGGGGAPPALYISDPINVSCNWTNTQPTANWFTPNHWSGNFSPNVSCDAQVTNISGNNQEAVIGNGLTTTVYRATITGAPNAEMAVVVTPGSGLLAYADVVVEGGGRLHLESNSTTTGKVNAQYIEVDDGALTGSGEIWVGAGPLDGSVRNNNGLIAPGDPNGDRIGFLTIEGDVANQATMGFDLGGTADGQFDTMSVGRNIYLEGTLDVDLVNGFTPAVGDDFQIISVGDRVVGQFDNLSLPAGFTWDVNYTLFGVEVEVTSILAGLICDSDGDADCDIDDLDAMYAAFGSGGQFDYDNSGTVDAGDIQGWLDAASSSLNPAKPNTTSQFVVGDVNLDGNVNSQDLGLLLNNFGNANSLGWGGGNLNGDALVNSADLGLLLNNFGHESALAAAVPEPGSISLLLFGVLFFVGRRRQ